MHVVIGVAGSDRRGIARARRRHQRQGVRRDGPSVRRRQPGGAVTMGGVRGLRRTHFGRRRGRRGDRWHRRRSGRCRLRLGRMHFGRRNRSRSHRGYRRGSGRHRAHGRRRGRRCRRYRRSRPRRIRRRRSRRNRSGNRRFSGHRRRHLGWRDGGNRSRSGFSRGHMRGLIRQRGGDDVSGHGELPDAAERPVRRRRPSPCRQAPSSLRDRGPRRSDVRAAVAPARPPAFPHSHA